MWNLRESRLQLIIFYVLLILLLLRNRDDSPRFDATRRFEVSLSCCFGASQNDTVDLVFFSK